MPFRFSSRAFSTATVRKLHAGPTELSQEKVCFKGRIVVDQGMHLGRKDDCDFQQQHTTWGSPSSLSVSKCHGFVWCCACRCILLQDCRAWVRYVALIGQANCGKATRLRSVGGALLPDNFDDLLAIWAVLPRSCYFPTALRQSVPF